MIPDQDDPKDNAAGSGKPTIAEGVMRGTAVSPGIGRGTAHVLACSGGAPALRREVAADEVSGELSRFDAALSRAEQDLLALKKAVGDSVGPSEGDIFAAQALVVRDPTLRNQVSALVRDQRINVESALAEVVQRFTRAFDDIPDPYLRERAADIRDVGRRVLSALVDDNEQLEVPEGAVVIADELLPSVTARLDLAGVRALVSEHGGRFSHASILARSQGTPAVVGIAGATRTIKTGDRLIVDGIAGAVFVNPRAQSSANMSGSRRTFGPTRTSCAGWSTSPRSPRMGRRSAFSPTRASSRTPKRRCATTPTGSAFIAPSSGTRSEARFRPRTSSSNISSGPRHASTRVESSSGCSTWGATSSCPTSLSRRLATPRWPSGASVCCSSTPSC